MRRCHERAGSMLGALFTFVLYGVLPVTILMYILGTPMRARARKRLAAAESARAQGLVEPDGSGHAPGVAIAPERKEG